MSVSACHCAKASRARPSPAPTAMTSSFTLRTSPATAQDCHAGHPQVLSLVLRLKQRVVAAMDAPPHDDLRHHDVLQCLFRGPGPPVDELSATQGSVERADVQERLPPD